MQQLKKDLIPTDREHNGEKIYLEQYKRQKRGVVLRECENCGANFTTRVHLLKTGKVDGRFCNKKCGLEGQKTVSLSGKDNPRYIGKQDYIQEVREKGCCSNPECDIDNAGLLSFHHVEPENKVGSVSRMAVSAEYSLEDVKEEVSKCKLYCENCHRAKHYRDSSSGSVPDEIPESKLKFEDYVKREEEYKDKNVYSKPDDYYRAYIIKSCEYCGQKFFAPLSEVKVGNARFHSQYCSTKQKWDDGVFEFHENRESNGKKELVDRVKEEGKCSRVECEEDRFACLQFHHSDRERKVDGISEMVEKDYSFEELQKELKKCILICANCHRKIHREGGSGI